MHSRSRRDRGEAQVAPRQIAGPLSSSTDTSGSSSRGEEMHLQFQPPTSQIGVQLPLDSVKDFKERVDSTIQQLSSLVSLLSIGTIGGSGSSGGGSTGAGRRQKRQLQSINTSNLGDMPCCGCHCHADGGAGGGSCSQATSSPQLRQASVSLTSAARRQLRSSRDLSAASRKLGSAAAGIGCITGGDNSDGVNDLAALTAPASSSRRKTATSTANAVGILPKPPQQQQIQPPRSVCCLVEPPTSGSIRFLWYDARRKRYSIKEAELICSKSVKRLQLSVHYFRVAGEDLLLLEKDCNEDGLAFLDVDSVVAFDGLSVEKVLKLQKLGCQLHPEDLSREFAVEKGRSKYYVVPVEEGDGDWQICAGAGTQKLDALKRVLEQQELRSGGGSCGGRSGGGGQKKSSA